MITRRAPVGPISVPLSSSYDPERNRLPSRLAPQREDTALISDDNGTGPGRAIPPISSLVDESQTDPFARNLLFSGSVEPPSGPHTPAPVSRRRHRSLFFSGDDDVEDDVNGNNGVGYNAQEDNDDTQDGLDDTQEDSNSHRASCSNSPRPTPSTGSPRKTRSSPAQRRRNKQITDLVQACTGRSLEIRIRMEEEKTKREEMRFALKREEGERRERMREKEQEWLLQLIRLSRQGQRGSQDGSQNGFNLGPLLSLGNAEEAQF
ncbi:uncharacterized protein SPSC_01946 [Sporisorium scitamineum]|uniref:Uncharacterized protein n=1 Tax=Sporisorium scitamineum TaxID=49012 RepID=A0A127ZCI8_9BASI|nr:uncharacterized protein SPSC_01946 [Sporisorium scitamineum]